MSNSSIWPIDRPLLGAATQGQSGTGSDGNEGALHIPKRSSITGASPSDCLVFYLGHLLGKSYLSTEMQSVYSTAPADRAISEFKKWILEKHKHIQWLSVSCKISLKVWCYIYFMKPSVIQGTWMSF